MPTVRVLKHWRGLPAGIFADVRGQHFADGLAENALDPKANVADHEGAKVHPDVIGEDDKPAAKPAKAAKS